MELLESGAATRHVDWGFAMTTEPTTAVVQRYLDALAGDQPAEPIVRDLLDRSVRRLQVLCGNLLYRQYRRLTLPPLNLQPDEMLSAVVERLLRAVPVGPPPHGAPVLRVGQPAHVLGAQ